jgi:hypothetical protein
MSTVSLELSDETSAAAEAQAAREGMPVHEYLRWIVASRVAARAEMERFFAERAARSQPGRALEILARVGNDDPPQPGDELPPDLAARLAAKGIGRAG